MILLAAVWVAGCGETASNPPKNVIIMISDGCGYNQVNAASLYQYGRTSAQVYEQFPIRISASTFSQSTLEQADPAGYTPDSVQTRFDYLKQRPTDSAAAATALASGTKTRNGMLGVDTAGVAQKTILERAEELGKATGVITTVMFSHATPGGYVAHTLSRNNYHEIGSQILLHSKADVVMGGGHPLFDNDGRPRTEPAYRYIGGEGLWRGISQGLATTDSGTVADADGDGTPDPWTLVQTREEFVNLGQGPTPKRVFGLFQAAETTQVRRAGTEEQTAPYGVPLLESTPTLAEMTRAALNVLDNDEDGLFLMIEGGAIDWMCHRNNLVRTIEEQIDFNHAVEAVVEWVERESSWEETMVLVTADHETGYLLGPGSGQTEAGPVHNELVNNGEGNLPGVQWNSGGHTNSLVPVYVNGNSSYLYLERARGIDPDRGLYIDNTDIPNLVFSVWADPTATQ